MERIAGAQRVTPANRVTDAIRLEPLLRTRGTRRWAALAAGGSEGPIGRRRGLRAAADGQALGGGVPPRDIAVAAGGIAARGGARREIAGSPVTARNIVARTVTAGTVTARKITAGKIAAGRITARRITARNVMRGGVTHRQPLGYGVPLRGALAPADATGVRSGRLGASRARASRAGRTRTCRAWPGGACAGRPTGRWGGRRGRRAAARLSGPRHRGEWLVRGQLCPVLLVRQMVPFGARPVVIVIPLTTQRS